METFEKTVRFSPPEKSSGSIISHAFEMYKGIFLYALLAMVIYIAVSMITEPVSGFDSQSLVKEITASGNVMNIDFWSLPGFRMYSGISLLIGLLFPPLYVGLIYIANKYNFGNRIQISDMFIGYRQNLINIIVYYILSSILMGIFFLMCVIPGFFVLPFFMLGYPFLLFENASFSEALNKSFSIAKENYGVFLGASFLGFLISISGVFLCGIGIIATAPFYLVVMYSLYCAFCGSPKELEFKN